MEGLWHTVNVNKTIYKSLSEREIGTSKGKNFEKNCQFAVPLLQRLDLAYSLDGHGGCVNCLQWTEDGKILASGSDDTHVRIWEPFSRKCLQVVETKHVGNIFSVKFLGNNSLVATGAGDYRVLVQSLEQADKPPILDCKCHLGRVKRLATAPDQPTVFWSAAEDGIINQYDLRTPHGCIRYNKGLINLHSLIEFKCIAANPTKPHLIAAGANDSFIRLYDRRFIKTSPWEYCATPPDENCVQYYAAGHLAKDDGSEQSFRLSATYLTFDATGNDLLANMGGEQIYLFNINNNRHIKQLKSPECLQNIDIKLPVKPCCCNDTKVRNSPTTEWDISMDYINPCCCDILARSFRFLKRQWYGDVYSAARIFLQVIQSFPEDKRAFLGLIECFINLKWVEEASNWLQYYKKKFPTCMDSKDIVKLEFSLGDLQTKLRQGNHLDLNVLQALPEQEQTLRSKSYDYETRFIGHCNTTTDIKEANFLGDDGNFIIAGSDDGLMFIWDRKTTNLLAAFQGDCSIVNCVQPHPSICCIASSGIDPGVKIWTPKREDENLKSTSEVNPWRALEVNQHRMEMNPFEAMLINMGYNFRPQSPEIFLPEVAGCRPS